MQAHLPRFPLTRALPHRWSTLSVWISTAVMLHLAYYLHMAALAVMVGAWWHLGHMLVLNMPIDALCIWLFRVSLRV